MGSRPLYHQETGVTYKARWPSCHGADRTGRGARARESDPDEHHVAGQLRPSLGQDNATWPIYAALISRKSRPLCADSPGVSFQPARAVHRAYIYKTGRQPSHNRANFGEESWRCEGDVHVSAARSSHHPAGDQEQDGLPRAVRRRLSW